MHQLTKTDFKYYLDCPESIWLLKNKPQVYPKGEFSLFAEKLIKEGYEVEAFAKQLFQNGLDLPEYGSPTETQKALADTHNVYFQPSFITNKVIFARIDILERLTDGSWHIYEVKSSTSIKKDRKHRQIEDACFQKYVLTECGYVVSKVSIIHLKKEYIKQGAIVANELLEITDVTVAVDSIYSSVVNQINSASKFINKEIVNETVCSCKYKTKSNHCDAFEYFNRDIPEYSIYQLNGIREKKLNHLIDLGILDLNDIPDNLNIKLSDKHYAQLNSIKAKKEAVNLEEVTTKLNNLNFPLHFFDYEGFGSAIPKLDGLKPHQQLVFQVSIHSLYQDGSIKHFEYLSHSMEMPNKLVEYMHSSTNGNSGTFICWHDTYERYRNIEMMVQVPKFESYLEYINSHLFDLKKLFYTGFAHYKFKGSASIKDVLPLLVPSLSYKDKAVQDGTMALDTWGSMVLDPNFNEDIETTRKNLLDYCELDTLAMVKIYEVLKELIN